MSANEIWIRKTDLAETKRVTRERPKLEAGQALLEIDSFSLTANNVSYASAGDMLGYWSFFPADEGWGCVPVWGFATVAASEAAGLPEGERIFGYFPLASHLVVAPDAITPLCFNDTTAHRAALHPWYNRYYRCGNDPVYSIDSADYQSVLWALFMTGWKIAEELTGAVDEVYVSSASSKTALSLAWALSRDGAGAKAVGVTSPANKAFVEALGVYSRVLTYDDLRRGDAERTAYVDMAGNAAATSAAHVALGDSLVDSLLVGATHRAPGDGDLSMPGPGPRFFFIPDIAEARSAAVGHDAYHGEFADAWHPFAEWAGGWLSIEHGSGIDAIDETYRSIVGGGVPPTLANVLSW